MSEEERKKYCDEMRAKMEKQIKDHAAMTPEQHAPHVEDMCKYLGVQPSEVIRGIIRQNPSKKDKP
jgi:hypothetical protein